MGNKVTKTAPSLSSILGGSGKLVTEGTYEITTAEDGSMTIVFTWSEGDVEKLPFSEIVENGVQSIRIGIVTYTKE